MFTGRPCINNTNNFYMKTKIEIIDETVAYYSEDPKRRATSSMTCQYITSDGRMCALGRCMLEPRPFDGGATRILGATRLPGGVYFDTDKIGPYDNILKDEYRGHEVIFWSDLQGLHDDGHFWNETGLSKSGKIHVQKLKQKYAQS